MSGIISSVFLAKIGQEGVASSGVVALVIAAALATTTVAGADTLKIQIDRLAAHKTLQEVSVTALRYSETYKALPGDDPRAEKRMGRRGGRIRNGNGDGRISTPESDQTWAHMAATGSVAGQEPPEIFGQAMAFTTPIGRRGMWITTKSPVDLAAIANYDEAHDDGDPSTGTVRTPSGQCGGGGHFYPESRSEGSCIFLYRALH